MFQQKKKSKISFGTLRNINLIYDNAFNTETYRISELFTFLFLCINKNKFNGRIFYLIIEQYHSYWLERIDEMLEIVLRSK